MMVFFSQFDQQRFNARFLSCTENTSSQSNRVWIWRRGKRQKKNLSPKSTRKPLTAQLREWGNSWHSDHIHYTFPFWFFRLSLGASFKLDAQSLFVLFGLFHPDLHFQYAVKLYRRGLLFGFFLRGVLVHLNMCNRTTYDVYMILLSMYSFSPPLLVAQDSKRQPCQLNRKEIGR